MSITKGLKGIGGGGLANLNPTEDFIPVRRNNEFQDSPMQVIYDNGDPTEILSSVPVNVGSGTLGLGFSINPDGSVMRGVTSLKDSGESFLSEDNVTGLVHTTPRTLINDDLNAPFGVGRTSVQDGTPFVWSTFGGTDTDEVTVSGDDRVSLTFREVLTAYVTGQRFRGTAGKMHYRVIDLTANDGIDTVLYTSQTGEPIDFDATISPDFQVEYETVNPNFLIQDHLLRLEFFSADGNPMTMRGTQAGAPNDPLTFTPFFETRFSVSRERVIFPNDEVQRTDVDFQPDESGILAVDTTSNPVTINIDPAFNKNITIFDSMGTFDVNNCTVDLQVYNTRTTPNDNIGATVGDAILCDDIDAGASGTKILLNNGGAPIFYNNGTHWIVETDSGTLTFDEVTNRTGLVFFRLLGERAALSVGDLTQVVEGVTGTQIEFDTIGDAVNPIDSVFHFRSVLDKSFTFDDDIVGQTEILNGKDDKKLFYYDISTNTWLMYDVRKDLVREAPDDGQSYIRNSKEWIPTEYKYFNDETIYTTNNTVPVTVLSETESLSEGVYEIGLSYSSGCTSTNRRIVVEFKIDGVSVGLDFEKESKDVADVHQPCKRIAKQLPAGSYDFTVEFYRDGGGGGSTVFIADIALTVERKL